MEINEIKKGEKSQIEKSRERSLGDVARDDRDWPTAALHYQLHLDRQPDDFATWVQLGHARREVGQFDGALIAYSRARAISEYDADIFLSLGHLYKLMGLKKEAAEHYGQSSKLDPSGPGLWNLNALGALLSEPQIDSFGSARQTIESAPKAPPHGITVGNGQAQAHAGSRPRAAILQDIEAKFGGRFSQSNLNLTQKHDYTPGDRLIIGDTIRQFFIVERPLTYIYITFFTFRQKNSSRIRVTISYVNDDLSCSSISEKELSGDEIIDGKKCEIFRHEGPIENSETHVYELKIELLAKEQNALISAAYTGSGVSALTIYKGAVQNLRLAMELDLHEDYFDLNL